MIKFPTFLGPVHTLTQDYHYEICGEIVSTIKKGTKVFFEGRNHLTGMYLYSY